MNFLRTFLLAFCSLLSAPAADTTWTLIWDRPATTPTITEYQVGLGRSSGNYTTFTNLISTNPVVACEVLIASDVWNYAAMRSVTTNGVSEWCDEVTWDPFWKPSVLVFGGVKTVIITGLQTNTPTSALAIPSIVFEQTFLNVLNGKRTVWRHAVPEGESQLTFSKAWPALEAPKAYVQPAISPRKAISIAPPSPVKKAAPKVNTAGSKKGKL